MKDNDKQYWYDYNANTYLSKEESETIIRYKTRQQENIKRQIINAYKDYKGLLIKANQYKKIDNQLNYLLELGEANSIICLAFEEIIKEFEKHDNQ